MAFLSTRRFSTITKRWASVTLALAALDGCAAAGPYSTVNLAELPQIAASPQDLIGTTSAVLQAEFGQPALLRVDGQAQVWLYHCAACGLDLVLYPDDTGTPRVAMAAPTTDSATPADCTANLQRAHISATLEHQAAS